LCDIDYAEELKSCMFGQWDIVCAGSGKNKIYTCVNACSSNYSIQRTHLRCLYPPVGAENGVLSACLSSRPASPSKAERVVHVQVAWRKRDRQAFKFRYEALRAEQHIEHIHKHSNTNPTTASNSVLPISAIPFNPSPSTSIRSSCGRFIRMALPTVVASV
jgi:hypothetical protein